MDMESCLADIELLYSGDQSDDPAILMKRAQAKDNLVQMVTNYRLTCNVLEAMSGKLKKVKMAKDEAVIFYNINDEPLEIFMHSSEDGYPLISNWLETVNRE